MCISPTHKYDRALSCCSSAFLLSNCTVRATNYNRESVQQNIDVCLDTISNFLVQQLQVRHISAKYQ